MKRAPQSKGAPGLNGLTKEGKRDGGRFCCTLLCPRGVTDVRRNVWVVRSLLRVPAEPHQWSTSTSSPPSPTSLHLQPPWLDERLSGVKQGALRQAPLLLLSQFPGPPVSGEVMGRVLGCGGSIKGLEKSRVTFIYQLPHQIYTLFSNFITMALKVVNSALLA